MRAGLIAPGFFSPGIHGAVFIFPSGVHGTDDTGVIARVLEPRGNLSAGFTVVVVTGEDLFESEVGKEFAVLAFEATMPINDADVFVESLPRARKRAVYGVVVLNGVVHGIEHVAPDPDFGVGPDVANDLRGLFQVPG